MKKPNKMTVDDLIAVLQRVKEEKGGDTVVIGGSFCGTNNGFVAFDITPIKLNKRTKLINYINAYGEFGLGLTISSHTIEEIKKGIAQMATLGFVYYRSQYVSHGQSPERGLSPCEWHTPW